MATLKDLLYYSETLGFDESFLPSRSVNGQRPLRIKCSQCEALVINGIATHEHGCPNARHECKGCNEIISVNQRYCFDCQY